MATVPVISPKLFTDHHPPDETHSEIHTLHVMNNRPYQQQYRYYADHTAFTKTNIALVNTFIYL